MSDDYGHYGKGTEGYIHYTQATNKSGGGGDGPKWTGPGPNLSWLVWFVVFAIACGIFSCIGAN